MKIKKLVVKNYKVFDHLELDFTNKNGEVLDTIVLAGVNGSGKTTILELLKDLIDGNTPQYLKENTEFRLEILFAKRNYLSSGLPEYSNQKEVYLSIKPYSTEYDILIFEYLTQKNTISDFASLNSVIYNLYQKMTHYQSIYNKPYISQAVYFYSNDKEIERVKERKNIIEATFGVHNQTIRQNILAIIQREVFNNPDQTPRSIFTKKVNDLNQIFKNLDVQSKLIQMSEKDLIFESSDGQKIPFNDLSSGEKMLYFMGFSLNQFNPEDALIMIDQPEDSLHPNWQQRIVRFFNNIGSNNQVILASHSPQILASVHPESLFVFSINKESHKARVINMA